MGPYEYVLEVRRIDAHNRDTIVRSDPLIVSRLSQGEIDVSMRNRSEYPNPDALEHFAEQGIEQYLAFQKKLDQPGVI